VGPLVEEIFRRGALHPERPALADSSRTMTYGELVAEARAWTALLQGSLGEGPRAVGVLLPNCVSFPAVLLGIAGSGHLAVLLPPTLTAPELRSWIRTAGARLVLSEPSARARLGAAGGREGGAGPGGVRVVRFDEAAAPEILPGDFIAQLTSGVDRPPKLAVRTQEAVFGEVQDFAAEIGLTEDDTSLVLPSISHSYGLVGGTLAPLCRGGRVVLGDPRDLEGVIASCRAERATLLFAVPVLYQRLAGASRGGPRDLASVRLCLSAGAPLSRDVEDAFLARFERWISQDYGCTEAGVITLGLDRHPLRRGSVGRPVRGRLVEIVSPGGQRLAPGQVGEVVVRTRALARAYLGDPAPPLPQGGGFRPGDLGWMTEDGHLFLAGRTSSLIATPAGLVNPADVEAAIAGLPGVREVAVVGVPRPGGGEGLKAVVVGEGVTATEIIGHCRRVLGDREAPEAVEFRAALPRTAAGKVLRRALRDPHAGSSGPP